MSELWREVWAKDSILDLIRRFAQVMDQPDDKGRPTGEKIEIFPRYHQLGCVRCEETVHHPSNALTVAASSRLEMSASARIPAASLPFSCCSLWMRSSTVSWQSSLWTKTGLCWPMR